MSVTLFLHVGQSFFFLEKRFLEGKGALALMYIPLLRGKGESVPQAKL